MLLTVLMSVMQVQAKTLKVLIPANVDAKFVRKWIPSVKQLLPTFNYFLYPTGVLENEYYIEEFDRMCHYNDYLIDLNNHAENLVVHGIDTHIFASESKDTLQMFVSDNQHSLDNCSRMKWADERPIERMFAYPEDGDAGDGRVLFHKSAYPVEDVPSFGMIPVSVVNGRHGSLPSKLSVINGIMSFLKEGVEEPSMN